MCIMYDCFNGDILQGTDRQAHARRLLREASRVVQADFPRLTYGFLEKYLGRYVLRTANIINPMMTSLVMGSTTAIEVRVLYFSLMFTVWQRSTTPLTMSPSQTVSRTNFASHYVNGWIVRRGAELGIPCPENAAMVGYVKEATKEVIEIKEKIIEARAALRRQDRRDRLALQRQENEEERRIHIEKGELAQIVHAHKRK